MLYISVYNSVAIFPCWNFFFPLFCVLFLFLFYQYPCASFIWIFSCEWTHRQNFVFSSVNNSLLCWLCDVCSVHSIYVQRRGFWELQCFEFIESIDNVTFIHNSSVRFPVILSTAYFSFLCLRYILRNEHLFNINWISFLRSCMWLVHKLLTVLCYAIGFNAGLFCYAHAMADIARSLYFVDVRTIQAMQYASR